MVDLNVKPAAPARSREASTGTTPRRLDSRELFRGGREVRIGHEGVEYRLRRTRHEKLILTK
jgi:hemin uptake protein HemP